MLVRISWLLLSRSACAYSAVWPGGIDARAPLLALAEQISLCSPCALPGERSGPRASAATTLAQARSVGKRRVSGRLQHASSWPGSFSQPPLFSFFTSCSLSRSSSPSLSFSISCSLLPRLLSLLPPLARRPCCNIPLSLTLLPYISPSLFSLPSSFTHARGHGLLSAHLQSALPFLHSASHPHVPLSAPQLPCPRSRSFQTIA